jgi:tape measure domain-containing protein
MAIGKLLLKLGIDTTNLDRELGKVEKSMSKFGNTMKNVGTNLTQSLTLPILGLGAASLKAFAEMEKLENGLIAIMGSSKEAGMEMEKLRKVAENPGLALPEVVKASASLQSVGMNADVARETITQFGNAVARAGGGAEKFDGVVLALSQISAVGKVTQEDLNQIKERLPEFARVMKEEFGVVTAEGIRELGISSEEFITRSVGALSNLERANGGLANTFDNLKDNVSASLAELGKSINETLNLEVVAAQLSATIQGLVEKFKNLSPETQGFIVKAGLFAAAVGPVILIIGQLATSISSIIALSRTLLTAFTFLSGGTVLLVAAIGSLIAYFATTDEGQKALTKTGELLLGLFNRLKESFSGTIELLGKLQPLFNLLLSVFGKIAVFTFEVVLSQINAVLSTINFLYDGVVKVLEGLRLINKQKVEPKINMGFGGGSAGKPSGAGGSWGDDKPTTVIETPEMAALKAKIKALEGQLAFKAKSTVVTPKAPIAPVTPVDMKAQTSALPDISNQTTGITNLLPTLDLYNTKLVSAAANNQRLKETNEDVKNSFIPVQSQMMSVGNMMTNALISAADAFSTMAMQGETDMKKMASAALQAARQIVSGYIKEGVAGIVKNILAGPTGKVLGPFAIAVAGAAGAGASVLFNSLLNKVSAPKLAQGGLAYGPTMATVGDNRNARVDPEVIAPLSKLKSMMGDMGIGGTLETRISGNDLIILLNRSQKGLNRVQ